MRIIKTKSSYWAGNGFGTAPAEYQAIHNGLEVADIWYSTCDWTVSYGEADEVGRRAKKSFYYLKDAKAFALTLIN